SVVAATATAVGSAPVATAPTGPVAPASAGNGAPRTEDDAEHGEDGDAPGEHEQHHRRGVGAAVLLLLLLLGGRDLHVEVARAEAPLGEDRPVLALVPLRVAGVPGALRAGVAGRLLRLAGQEDVDGDVADRERPVGPDRVEEEPGAALAVLHQQVLVDVLD